MSLKLAIMLALYLFTGGAIFSGRFNKYTLAVIVAGLVAIAASLLFWRDAYEELAGIIVSDAVERIEEKQSNSDGVTQRLPTSNASNAVDENLSSSSVSSTYITDVYRDAAPPTFELGDVWGEFHLDGSCTLKYGESVVGKLDYYYNSEEQRSACSYQPKFSVSPSSNYIAVLMPTDNYGYSHVSVVDLLKKEVMVQNAPLNSRVNPSTGWSQSEDFFLVKRQAVWQTFFDGYTGAFGTQPCVFSLTRSEMDCEDEQLFVESIVAEVIRRDSQNQCLRTKTCYLKFDVESTRFVNDKLIARIGFETSIHQNRQLDQPTISEGMFEYTVTV